MKRAAVWFFLLTCFVYAQNKFLLKSNGEILSLSTKEKSARQISNHTFENAAGSIDTMMWGVQPNINFGTFGQDWVVQWFEAPADMIIKAIGYNCASASDSSAEIEVKLVKLVWPKDSLLIVGEKALGYYEALGNGQGDATAFWDNPDRTGYWINAQRNSLGAPFGEDIWSDSGAGYRSFPIPDGKYQFIETNALGYEPEIPKGTLIGIAVKNASPELNEGRIGFVADNGLGIPSFKYYAGGAGWRSLNYTFDFALAVEFPDNYCRINLTPYLPPIPPMPNAYSVKIYFRMYFFGDCADVADSLKGTLYYAFDEDDFQSKEMAVEDTFYLFATIPKPGPDIHSLRYYATVETEFGEFTSGLFSLNFFYPSSDNLLLFNGFTAPSGYPQSYYFGTDDFVDFETIQWEHDVWSYGPLSSELIKDYKNIIEITTSGPTENNSEVVKEWLNLEGDRNYLLAGDEWFGVMTGWKDTVYQPGDFEYDILGVKKIYNDINFTESGDQTTASPVLPVQNSLLGGELYNLFLSQGVDTMLYDPKFEVGENNWLDGAEFLDDVEVDMIGYSKRNNKWYPIAGHRSLPNGNKIVLMLYDPLSLNSAPDYYWFGFSQSAPQVQALKWFGIYVTSARNNNENIPGDFALYQNYPNPFNPATIIKYSIPNLTAGTRHASPLRNVELKVYDVLGREVATLVKEKQSPGNYEVSFDASGLSSGIYFYTLRVEERFFASKKLLLLK